MGVEYEPYTDPATGEGFVVCLIPESRYKPHRAEWADKHYYYRAGDDFLMAEPGLLRTLFYPQLHPFFRVEVTLNFSLMPDDLAQSLREHPNDFAWRKLLNQGESRMSLVVILHNIGTATAKDAFVVIQGSHSVN